MKNLFFNLVCFALPERIVRMMFMCSIYRGLYRINTIDARLSQRVNTLLRICDDDYALGWGVKASVIFWNDETVVDLQQVFVDPQNFKLTSESVENLTNKILSHVPKYLCYGQDAMRCDVKKIITQHEFLNHTPSFA